MTSKTNTHTRNLVTQDKVIDKSMAKVCILDILRTASEEHPMTQDVIRKQLESKYGMVVNRKTVHNHLRQLIDGIDSIKYTKEERTTSNGSHSMLSDFWIDDEDAFEEVELQMLLYGVIFNKHIPTQPKHVLINKLERLTSSNIRHKLDYYLAPDNVTTKVKNELTVNLELITEAIDLHRKIRFQYKEYVFGNTVKEEEHTFTVSPFGIGSSNNDFILVGTLNGAEYVSGEDMEQHFSGVLEAMKQKKVFVNSFKIDRIERLELLDENSEDLSKRRRLKLEGVSNGALHITEYMRFNPRLSSGYTVSAKLLLFNNVEETTEALTDLFAKTNVRKAPDACAESGKCTYIASVRGNKATLRDFALQHIDSVELLEPIDLREGLARILQAASSRYNEKCT